MADRNRKRGLGDESEKGKGRREKRFTGDQHQWGIHVQLGSHLTALHEEEESLEREGRILDHRKVVKKIRTTLDLISYELRHRAELLDLIRHEGIEDDVVLVRDFLKYQLKKHRSADPQVAGPSSRRPLEGAPASGSDGELGEHPKGNEEVEESDDEIKFELAPRRMQKKRG